ncbi:UROD/MetE-like protein [Dichomitus squalens LYAD-421 SS1]|uniref:UROD/MetE-like protein n=1 Tax=Dichomitus squalens (strain LYAD-421) TaxID=732165 RepID=UPI00044158E7|nr:UROD/MetE-like protein [Dichomitus squalens LYAD-421 SS1]EJF66787.1 UROD/MetE-like protein [Dichomitus squalens LYAD-421 SS1]
MVSPVLAKYFPRADHVGSLLRPQELVEKRIAFHSGQCTAEDLKAVEDEAVPQIVKLQKDLGLTVLTDGEVRRAVYNHGMFEQVEGMTVIPDRPFSEYVPYLPYVQLFSSMGIKGFTSTKTTGKLRRTKPVHVHEFLSLKQHVSPEDVSKLKITMCSPTWMHLRHGSEHTYDHAVYKDDAEYFADLVKVFREEVQDLYDHGCRRIQFDDPGFAFYCSNVLISGMEAAGVDREKLLDTHIDVYNQITAGRPADLVIGVHTCRGNMKGMHFSEGSYDHVAQQFLTKLDVDVFYLEYDTDRAGGLEPLRYLPLGKHVVLGLVTTKSGALEDIETVKGRVRRAAEIISEGQPRRSYEQALGQISISPQCGFASVFEGNPITEEDEKKKLALVVAAARELWG